MQKLFLVLAVLMLLVSGTSLSAAEKGAEKPWILAAAGDAIVTRRLSVFEHEPAYSGLLPLLKGADAAFVNLELSLFRLSGFKGWPEVENGGNWELGPPEAATELKQMGFNLFARANNHALDFGVEGMRKTDQLLDDLGLVHAGTGENLGMASRPGYLDTPRRRVALISFATTFTTMSRAGAVRQDMPGRPGINALRVKTTFTADRDTVAKLRKLAERMGTVPTADPAAPFNLQGIHIASGDKVEVVEQLHQGDQERILREIRNAANQAESVLVSSHTHEPNNLATVAPDWLQAFARQCIDAGATSFIAHGPHQLRGIEIYKGRPIFYSLGNFIFQNETIDPMPHDAYQSLNLPETALAADYYNTKFNNGTTGFPTRPPVYESVLAVATFSGNSLKELKLHPVQMGRTEPRSQRGTPRLATGEQARTIIEGLARLSAPLGTTIRFEKGAGVWRP